MADYTKEEERDLLRAAQFYEKQKSDARATPEQRASAAREHAAISQEFERRNPITIENNIPASPDLGPPSRNLEPSDPGPPIPVPQGALSGERYSREHKYGTSDLKADVGKVAGVVAPAFGVVNDKFVRDEEQARAEAAANAVQAPAGQGVNLDELRAAEAQLTGGSGPTMGVSTTQGNTSQVERKILPPAWYKSLERFTGQATDQAVGGTAEQLALMEATRRAAERRRAANEDFRHGVEQSALREASALGGARRRIGSAIEAYKASGPRFESLGTVLSEAPGAKGFAGGVGLIMGIIGGAATGQANGFTEAVMGNIERRAKLAELDSEKQGRALGFQGEQYRRLDQELGDARATRSLIRAMYLEEFKDQLIEQGAKVGIMSGDARLAGLLAQIEQVRMGHLEKAASVVMNQSRSEQTVAPIKGTGNDAEGNMGDYIEERRKRGMDVMEGGIRLMQNGVQQIDSSKPNSAQSLLFRQVLADPGSWATASSVMGQITPGQQSFLNGFLQFLQSDAGKALTKDERAGIASAAGRGDVAGLQEMVRNFQTRYDALERGLVPKYGKTIQLFRLRQQMHDAENPRKTYDVRGVETQPPVTERPPVSGGP